MYVFSLHFQPMLKYIEMKALNLFIQPSTPPHLPDLQPFATHRSIWLIPSLYRCHERTVLWFPTNTYHLCLVELVLNPFSRKSH